MTEIPRDYRDGFLAGYLPYLVMLHFDTLALLLNSKELPSFELRIKALPARGPETVSRTLVLESIIATRGMKPPARPNDWQECAAWAKSIDGGLQQLETRTAAGEIRLERDHAFGVPRHAGTIVGDLEQALSLSLLVFELLREAPDHPLLVRQRDVLLDGIRSAALAKGAKTRLSVNPGSPLGKALADAVSLAERCARVAASDTTPDTMAAMLRYVRHVARVLERSYAERGPSDAIAARARQEIGEVELHRALLEHPSWSTATERPIEAGTYFVTSSPATFAPWASATGRGSQATELGSGWHWVLGTPGDVQRVVINPTSAAEHVIEGATWSAFRERAAAAKLRTAWRDWSEVNFTFLARAPHAVIVGADGRSVPVPWSDELRRPYAAIFTSEASLRRTLEVGNHVVPEGARIGTAPAKEIAVRLLAANAPALVVDPDSTERPRTFSRGTLARLST